LFKVYEPFLDLSLPLVEEKPPRPSVGKKNKGKSMDEEGDGDVFVIGKKAGDKTDGDEIKSKGQLKKEREKKKKEKKQNRRNTAKSGKQVEGKAEDEESEIGGKAQQDETRREDEQVPSEEESSEETKIKKELEETEKVQGEAEAFISEKKEERHCDGNEIKSKSERDAKDGNEEDDEEDEDDGYGENWEWESTGRQSEERSRSKEAEDIVAERVESNIDEAFVPESKTPLVSLNPLPPERLERGSSEREKSSEDSAAAEADPEDDNGDATDESVNGDVEDNIEDKDALLPGQDRLDPHMKLLCQMVENVSVSASSVYADGNADAAVATEKVPSQDNHDWVMRSLSSIGNRYQPSSGECSVYSCLAQFTARELLTGNNKWACDRCTAMQRKDADASDDEAEAETEDKPKKKKVVYSNASKQLLLYSPPAVLTVHLKRFEQTFRGLRKVNRHVSFPLVLDLAPFCASTAVSTPTVAIDATKILYSLYAVVEHSGGLQGGHYTAFVKTKDASSAAETSAFLTSPITLPIDFHAHLEQMQAKSNCNGVHHGDEEPTQKPCKWYHISDSKVTEATQDKVLSSQAYLLFYERIL
jgi:ubiquitin carboxyl-terminal hydrolase 16/45